MYVFCNQVDLLKNKFGYDEAINYKEEHDLNAALKGQYITVMQLKNIGSICCHKKHNYRVYRNTRHTSNQWISIYVNQALSRRH